MLIFFAGYYIPTCAKSIYKTRFRSLQLLDCKTQEWHPYEQFKQYADLMTAEECMKFLHGLKRRTMTENKQAQASIENIDVLVGEVLSKAQVSCI